MFHVLAQPWGWQEKTAKQWLARFAGTVAYAEARKHAVAPPRAADDDLDGPDDATINGSRVTAVPRPSLPSLPSPPPHRCPCPWAAGSEPR